MKNLSWKTMTLTASILALMLAGIAGCSSQSSQGTEAAKETSYLQQVKDRGVLRVATNGTFAPFTFIDQRDGKNENVGSDIELAKYIADQLGVELELSTVEQAAVVSGTAEGRYDLGISACGKTEERERVVDFTSLYYVADAENCETIFVREADADQYHSLDDFVGKVVGVSNGTVEESLANAQLPEGTTIQKYDNTNDGMLALSEGKIDAYCLVDTVGNLYISNNPGCALTGSGVNFQVDEDGAAIIMAKNRGDFYDYIENIVLEVRNNGQYQEWLNEATELAEELGVE